MFKVFDSEVLAKWRAVPEGNDLGFVGSSASLHLDNALARLCSVV